MIIGAAITAAVARLEFLIKLRLSVVSILSTFFMMGVSIKGDDGTERHKHDKTMC
jgi:hypothetical protein